MLLTSGPQSAVLFIVITPIIIHHYSVLQSVHNYYIILYFYYLLLLPSNDDGFIAFSYLFPCFAIPEMSSSLRSHYHYYHTWQGKRSVHTHTCHVVLKSVRMTGMNIDIYYLKQGSYAAMETWKTYRSMGIMTQKSWNTVGIEN